MKFLYSCTAFMLLNPSSDAANLIPASDSRGVVTLSEVTPDSQPQIVSNDDSLQNAGLTEPTSSVLSHKVPPKVVKGMTLGFGITGGIIAVTGITVSSVGGALIPKTATCTDPTKNTCVLDFAINLNIRDAGLMVFGTGLGFVGGGLPWLAKDSKLRKKIWIAQAVIGSASFIGGFVGAIAAIRPFNLENVAGKINSWEDHYKKYHAIPGHAVATTFWGLGIGLIVSSASGLIVQRVYLGKNLSIRAAMDFGQAGVVLSGKF